MANVTDETANKPDISQDVTKDATLRHKGRHKVATCPHCGHPMQSELAAIGLRGKQARIFEMVARAGTLGLYASEILDRLYGDDPEGGPSGNALSAQVRFINMKLKPRGLVITAGGGGGGSFARKPYRLLALEGGDGT